SSIEVEARSRNPCVPQNRGQRSTSSGRRAPVAVQRAAMCGSARDDLTTAGAARSAAGTIVAVLVPLHDAIAAEWPEHAAFVAFTISAIVLAVVALLAEAQDPVSAHGRTVARSGFKARQRQAEG